MVLPPILALILLFLVSTVIGIAPVRKMIQVHEAKHELKQGSVGFLNSIAGWSIIAFWAMAVWYCASILGDWQMSGDLGGALERGSLRLRILLDIAMSMRDE